MINRDGWMQHFEVTPEALEAWRKDAGPHEDPLQYALRVGAIDQGAYLSWASEAFSMPYVSPSFFALGLDRDLWDRVRAEAAWTSALIPLHEWQGVLIVGCVSPPGESVTSRAHALVLAPAEALAERWVELSRAAHAEVTPNVVEAAPAAAVSPAFEVPDGFAMSFSFGDAPDSAPQVAESTPEGEAPLSFEAPEGFMLAAPTAAPAAPALAAPAKAPATPPPPAKPAPSLNVVPFAKPPEPPPPAAPTSSNPFGAQTPVLKATTFGEPSASTPPPPPTKPAFGEPTSSKAPPATSPRSFPKRDVHLGTSSDDSPIELTHTGVSVARVLEPNAMTMRFDNCQTYEEAAEAAFRLLSPPYQKAMTLVFQGGLLKPWKWTQEFQPTKEKPDSIDLVPPSVFRIVYNTLQPYHGRVVPNDVNSRFFDQVAMGRIPSTLTIAPILIDRQVAGMLLCAADGEINPRTSLALSERVAEQMGEALKRIRSKKAAA